MSGCIWIIAFASTSLKVFFLSFSWSHVGAVGALSLLLLGPIRAAASNHISSATWGREKSSAPLIFFFFHPVPAGRHHVDLAMLAASPWNQATALASAPLIPHTSSLSTNTYFFLRVLPLQPDLRGCSCGAKQKKNTESRKQQSGAACSQTRAREVVRTVDAALEFCLL